MKRSEELGRKILESRRRAISNMPELKKLKEDREEYIKQDSKPVH